MTDLSGPLRSVWWHGFVTACITVGGLLLGVIAVILFESAR
jgi:hypothetical protein